MWGQHLQIPYLYVEYEYQCPNCVYRFRTHEDLIYHFSHDEYHAFNAGLWKLKHPNYTETPIFCFRCSKVVKDLLHHWGFTAKHHVCWACGLDYSTAENLAEHVRGRGISGDCHLANYLRFNLDQCYHCKDCYMVFPSLSTRRHHESEDLIHGGRKILKYASSVCYDPSLLTVKDRSGWMYCHRCRMVISDKGPSHDTLDLWEKHKESSTNHNTCLLCRLDFPKDKSLKVHINEYHMLDFACPRENCRKIYKTMEKVQDHCAEKTGFVYPWDEHVDFQCDHCTKILGSLEAWQKHMTSDPFHLSILEDYDFNPFLRRNEQAGRPNNTKHIGGNKEMAKVKKE